jgi:large subunit ribosomal protein L32e
MKMVEELLKFRKQVKSRKPKFKRQQTNQFAKLRNSDKWRKPRGRQAKMRLRKKGHRKMPTVGFGSPNSVRGLNSAGFREVIVYSLGDLKNIDQKNEAVVIGKTVGSRKKIVLLEESKKLKLIVANVLDIDKKIKDLTKESKTKKTTEKKTTQKQTEESVKSSSSADKTQKSESKSKETQKKDDSSKSSEIKSTSTQKNETKNSGGTNK